MRPMNQRILMVDDEAPIRELYSLYFRTVGFHVQTASNETEAMALLDIEQFDLIILDFWLGRQSGLDLIEPMKKKHPKTPILIYTGKVFTETSRQDALARGASG